MSKEQLLRNCTARNLKGIRFEKRGIVDKAVELYEQNILDEFDGDHPYERLRIIYNREERYDDVIRVCQLYLKNVQQDQARRERYKKIISKLLKKITK